MRFRMMRVNRRIYATEIVLAVFEANKDRIKIGRLSPV